MSAPRLCRLLSISITLLLLPATAQPLPNTLTIHVTDPAGASIPGASVGTTSRDGWVRIVRITDGLGEARFESVAPGPYVVDVEAPGVASTARTITIRGDVPRISIAVDLPTIIEHVVTGVGHLQTASEVSKAVTVIDANQIRARNKFAVADALLRVPGATVQKLGEHGAFTSVKLRGLREQYTAAAGHPSGVRARARGGTSNYGKSSLSATMSVEKLCRPVVSAAAFVTSGAG